MLHRGVNTVAFTSACPRHVADMLSLKIATCRNRYDTEAYYDYSLMTYAFNFVSFSCCSSICYLLYSFWVMKISKSHSLSTLGVVTFKLAVLMEVNCSCLLDFEYTHVISSPVLCFSRLLLLLLNEGQLTSHYCMLLRDKSICWL